MRRGQPPCRGAEVVRAGRRCVRLPSAAPTAPGLLLAGWPAARPPPVSGEMAVPGAAAGGVRRVLEQLRWVSPGLGGLAGAERLRRGKPELSAPGRPGLGCCSPRGKGPEDPEGQVDAPDEPVSFPTPGRCLF